jgi:hypothetical protein
MVGYRKLWRLPGFRGRMTAMGAERRDLLQGDLHRLEWLDIERRYEQLAESHEEFDRIAFAMKLLRLVPVKNTTVIFHESYHGVRVELGRDYARGNHARWAMLGISPHASREWIALAIAEIAGVERVPFIVDLLVQSSALGEAAREVKVV